MKKLISILLVAVLAFSALGLCVNAKTDGKNVILMIGDGMGINSIKWTEQVYGETLFISTIKNHGWSKTNSWSGTTDSAAGGTALATGRHTFNRNVACSGFEMFDKSVKFTTYLTLCELAKSMGMKTGVLTSDKNSGATPSDFTAHVGDRGLNEEICTQQLHSNFDLIWAKTDDFVTPEKIRENGWTRVTTYNEVMALPDYAKSFGQFDNEIENSKDDPNEASLSNLTVQAIKQLDDGNGFFLMVEGAHIDKNSHKKNADGMTKAMYEFDNAVENAINFAKEDGNTVVIITADHETGAISFDKDSNTFEYNSGSHSNTNVPVFVYGSDDFVTDGEVKVNTDVAKFAAKALGSYTALPVVTYNKDFLKDFFTILFEGIFGSSN